MQPHHVGSQMRRFNLTDIHPRCICKAEWCYVCGAAWQTCKCPVWDEAMLLERAARDIQRAPAGHNAAALPAARQIQARVAQLRDNHDCQHITFRKVGGVSDCDNCGLECRMYFNRCQQCHLDLCYVCLHRL